MALAHNNSLRCLNGEYVTQGKPDQSSGIVWNEEINRKMPHVFISYVRENLDAAARLRDALEAYGIEVWFDRERIAAGARWAGAIRDGITQGAFYIACFSEEYSKRSRTYMNEELVVAIEELRLRPFDRTWFIPVILSPCEIPNRSIGAGETLRSFQWIDLSENWNEGVRRILAVIQPVSSRVDELIHALADQSHEVVSGALHDLTAIGLGAKNAAPTLLRMLEQETTLQEETIGCLQAMEASDDQIVSSVILGCEKQTNQAWSRDGSPVLISMGERIVPVLLREFDKPHNDPHLVRNLLFRTVEHIGSCSVPYLVSALEKASDDTKFVILQLISTFGRDAQAALPAVLREMDSSNQRLRSIAIEALGGISDPSTVPLLISLLDDPSLFVRPSEQGTPAQALGRIGDPSAVPELLKFMSDPKQDPSLRRHCAHSLGEIGHPTAVASLADVLESENNETELRIAACFALRNMGQVASPILGRLYRLLIVSRNDEVLYHTALVVITLGGDLQQALPQLMRELKFGKPLRRQRVAGILKDIGPKAKDTVPALLDVLGQENWVRDEIIAALKAIDPGISSDALETREFEQH